jgi:hypothetical protein
MQKDTILGEMVEGYDETPELSHYSPKLKMVRTKTSRNKNRWTKHLGLAGASLIAAMLVEEGCSEKGGHSGREEGQKAHEVFIDQDLTLKEVAGGNGAW